jgi:hypothetical protein
MHIDQAFASSSRPSEADLEETGRAKAPVGYVRWKAAYSGRNRAPATTSSTGTTAGSGPASPGSASNSPSGTAAAVGSTPNGHQGREQHPDLLDVRTTPPVGTAETTSRCPEDVAAWDSSPAGPVEDQLADEEDPDCNVVDVPLVARLPDLGSARLSENRQPAEVEGIASTR